MRRNAERERREWEAERQRLRAREWDRMDQLRQQVAVHESIETERRRAAAAQSTAVAPPCVQPKASSSQHIVYDNSVTFAEPQQAAVQGPQAAVQERSWSNYYQSGGGTAPPGGGYDMGP